MGKYNYAELALKNQKCIGEIVQQLINDRIINKNAYTIGKCCRTGRGNPTNPKIEYGHNGNSKYRCYGNQKLILIHCGQGGCHPLFVVPKEGVNLEAYVKQLEK